MRTLCRGSRTRPARSHGQQNGTANRAKVLEALLPEKPALVGTPGIIAPAFDEGLSIGHQESAGSSGVASSMSSRIVRFEEREDHDERRAGARYAADGHATAMDFDDRFHDCQTEASTASTSVRGMARSEKPIKDTWDILQPRCSPRDPIVRASPYLRHDAARARCPHRRGNT